MQANKISERQEELARESNRLSHAAKTLSERSIAEARTGNVYGRIGMAIQNHRDRHDAKLLDVKVKQMETMANLSALVGGLSPHRPGTDQRSMMPSRFYTVCVCPQLERSTQPHAGATGDHVRGCPIRQKIIQTKFCEMCRAE